MPESSAEKIESLKSNLSYGEIRLEKYKELQEFIVIPVLSGFNSANNSGKDPVNYLVLVFENQDKITKGNIIQFISSNNQKTVPVNTFNKIFTYKNIGYSGQFTILSITDYFQYELNFENGKLKSIKEQKQKAHPKNANGRVNEDGCIDWYEQTWYIYEDGNGGVYAELVSEIYVFTTCEGDCWQARIANGRSLRVNCNGSPGGGGGNPIEYEFSITADRHWNAWQHPATSSMYIWQWDQYWGKRQAGTPNCGYFTKITNLDGGLHDFPYYMNAIITSNVAWNNTSITHHEVQGYITSQIAPNEYFTKDNIVAFNELWPC